MQKEREAFSNWFGASFTNGKIEFDADGVPIGYEKAIAWKAWKAAKASAKSEFNNFILEYKKTLIKTYEDDKDNTHDYWRGFANCAKSSENVLNAMIEAAQEQNQ